MRIGSLCTGYGGIDLALGGETVFVSEIDKDANTVIAQRFPGVPNLGDFTKLDRLPECDVLTAGFPCQPVSQAGKRAGTDDERWLWDDIERVVGGMERPPGVLFLENVRGLLSANGGAAMGRVVSGLARLGYVGSYRLVSAASVGACHRRERVFIVAAHADGQRLKGREVGHVGAKRGRQPERVSGVDLERSGVFGPYWPAVARWERIIGRPAPDPTTADTKSGPDSGGQPRSQHVCTTADTRSERARMEASDPGGQGRQPAADSERALVRPGDGPSDAEGARTRRLNPRFVEWMMGLPDGWVTDTGVSRTAQLKILGNGVVPQQAAAAWHMLGQRSGNGNARATDTMTRSRVTSDPQPPRTGQYVSGDGSTRTTRRFTGRLEDGSALTLERG
jgi:DNA (cytosine-5)-methyltransferase 1